MATINSINTEKPVEVASGGQGNSSLTAYAVVCGGTTSTGATQSIASAGTSGQVLTSNGAASLPTFQAAAGGGSLVLIETITASSDASLDFKTGIDSTYTNYLIKLVDILPATDGASLYLKVSDDAGSTWKSGTAYTSGVNSNAFNSTTLTNANVNGGAQFQITATVDTSVGIGIGMSLYLFDISNGNTFNLSGSAVFTRQADTITSYETIVGYYSTAITVTGLQLIMSAGNVASGSASLYGIAD